MKTITAEQLEQLDQSYRFVMDIRPENYYRKGTFPGAVNIPAENLNSDPDEQELLFIPKDKPVYVLSHTGKDSVNVAFHLQELGYDAWHVEGGYRSYLCRDLERTAAQEVLLAERTAKAERSIIKKFRKQLWTRFTKAVTDYQLIQEGDRIAVCISGGKDSMLLAKLMQEIQRHGKIKFDLVFLCMNPGYHEDNWKIVQSNAKLLGIPLTVFDSQIFDIVATEQHHPCYLCARMRRGFLYANAKKLGCNKIALGHHYDDVIETILMGILYSGKTETMLPRLKSQNFEGMQLIRPLYLIREESICDWRDYNDLHFIQCACRFTENCASSESSVTSKRQEVKALIAQLHQKDPVIEQNIFNCVRDINLRTIIGCHKDGKNYSFLDEFEDEDKGSLF